MSYATRSDLNEVFGKPNVDKWADLDNDGVSATITARITKALAVADDEVNNRLRNGLYALPIVLSEGGTPVVIVDAAAKIAGCWLYTSRGLADTGDGEKSNPEKLRDEARDALAEIRGGNLILDAELAHSVVPEAFDLDEEAV